MTKLNFNDFHNGIHDSGGVNVDWDSLESQIDYWSGKDEKAGYPMSLNWHPEYQRGHVWSEAQQRAYVEFKVHGGIGGNVVLINKPGYRGEHRPRGADYLDGQNEIVDGVQRLTAVLKFMRNELPIFMHLHAGGVVRGDFENRRVPSNLEFIVKVQSLWYKRDVLRWYLALNSTGTPHTREEIERVRTLLENQ